MFDFHQTLKVLPHIQGVHSILDVITPLMNGLDLIAVYLSNYCQIRVHHVPVYLSENEMLRLNPLIFFDPMSLSASCHRHKIKIVPH